MQREFQPPDTEIIETRVVVTTSATAEPVTNAEMRTHLRVTTTGDDTYIGTLITAARQTVESITNRAIMPQTRRMYLDQWPDDEGYLNIPYPPLRSVASTGFVYKNSTGGSATFSSTAWETDTASEPGRLWLKNGESWPSVNLYAVNPIQITFSCGYTTSSKVPAAIKHAIKLLAADMYEHREPTVIGQTVQQIPKVVDRLLAPYRVFSFGGGL